MRIFAIVPAGPPILRKFLAREVQRLQAESSLIDAKLAQAKLSPVRSSSRTNPDQTPSQLAQLRAELAQKSAIYSDRNFQIQALKRQIEALEKVAPQPAEQPADSAEYSAAGRSGRTRDATKKYPSKPRCGHPKTCSSALG